MGLSIKDYEDRLVNDGNTDAADKLRLCRMIRNYLSHHADGDELVTVNNNLSAFTSIPSSLNLSSSDIFSSA